MVETHGLTHISLSVRDPEAIDRAVREAEAAGGRILCRGEFGPGQPFVYVADPDGYEIELWFE